VSAPRPERFDGNSRGGEFLAQPGRECDGIGRVTMQADGLTDDRHIRSRCRPHHAALHNREHLLHHRVLIRDHRARFAARSERAVGLVCPIGEHLFGHPQSARTCRAGKLTAGKRI
jgi:hypothetical protein